MHSPTGFAATLPSIVTTGTFYLLPLLILCLLYVVYERVQYAPLVGSKRTDYESIVATLTRERSAQERDHIESCLGYQRHEFCSASGPPIGDLLHCDADITANKAGICHCQYNYTVHRFCEPGALNMTCMALCANVLRDPAASLGSYLRVFHYGVFVEPREGPLIEGIVDKTIRRVQTTRDLYELDADDIEHETLLRASSARPLRYPTAKELNQHYGWPRQGGGYQGKKPNAVYLVLSMESRARRLVNTLVKFEEHINKQLQYPYAVFNDQAFSESFKENVSGACSTGVTFHVISEGNWKVPDWIDQGRLKKGLRKHAVVPYMDSLSYRLMCRWNSGFFFREPAMAQYEYFWRVDDDVFYYCPIVYDPIVLMQEKGKQYAFNIALDEHMLTIKTLWKTVSEFTKLKNITPQWPERAYMGQGKKYTGCHFWSNFEIGSLEFFRSADYLSYFEHLDKVCNTMICTFLFENFDNVYPREREIHVVYFCLNLVHEGVMYLHISLDVFDIC